MRPYSPSAPHSPSVLNFIVEDVKVCSLASGSNGNIYYVEFGDDAIVVDMGISFRRLKNRAQTRHIDLKKIRAVLVSHEHSDHVYGLPALCRHTGAMAYMTRGTFDGMRVKYRPAQENIRFINIGDPITIGPFTAYSFDKPHDVEEPCSFRIEVNGVNIGVFTDIGDVCPGLEQNLALCNLAFLESNYDEDMLRNGNYPAYLKNRIVSGRGHLSNIQAADLVRRLAPPALHTIFLSHISHENNRPTLALQAFDDLRQKYEIRVMSRDEASDVWSVTTQRATCLPPVIEIPERLDRVPLNIFSAI